MWIVMCILMHIKALHYIIPLMDVQTANVIACSTICSWLDYCNSLLVSVTAHNIERLQQTRNNAKQVVCRTTRYTSPKLLLKHYTSPKLLLKQLHWLPVWQFIRYKIGYILSIPIRNATLYSRIAICLPKKCSTKNFGSEQVGCTHYFQWECSIQWSFPQHLHYFD